MDLTRVPLRFALVPSEPVRLPIKHLRRRSVVPLWPNLARRAGAKLERLAFRDGVDCIDGIDIKKPLSGADYCGERSIV